MATTETTTDQTTETGERVRDVTPPEVRAILDGPAPEKPARPRRPRKAKPTPEQEAQAIHDNVHANDPGFPQAYAGECERCAGFANELSAIVAERDQARDAETTTTTTETSTAGTVVWEEPPMTTTTKRTAWQDTLEQLQAHPGKWARVAEGHKYPNAATTWRKRGCEARAAKPEGSTLYTVWARWPETGK